jgi:hypothetical protein
MNTIESELNYLALCITKWNNGVWKMPEKELYEEFQQKYKTLLENKKNENLTIKSVC